MSSDGHEPIEKFGWLVLRSDERPPSELLFARGSQSSSADFSLG